MLPSRKKKKMAVAASPPSAPWANLAPDLVEKISELLTPNISDYIRFRAVCSSWRHATLDPCKSPLPPPFPWIMLSSTENSDIRYFYSLADDKVHPLSLPLTRHSRILGSVDGWLVVINNAAMVSLLNPLTKALVHLPPLTRTDPRYLKDGEYAEEGNYIVHRKRYQCVVSMYQMRDTMLSKLNIMPDGTVVGIMSKLDCLVFAKTGDERWNIAAVDKSRHDIVAFQGGIYLVDDKGQVALCDLETSGTVTAITLTDVTTMATEAGTVKWYLVESSGELLVVARYMVDSQDWQPGDAVWTKKFEVFKLDMSAGLVGRLDKVQSLGDRMLFLGANRSLSLTKSDCYPAWKGNRIYFTACLWRIEDNGNRKGNDLGVFNLDDGVCESLPLYWDRARLVWPPPIWFTPIMYNSLL